MNGNLRPNGGPGAADNSEKKRFLIKVLSVVAAILFIVYLYTLFSHSALMGHKSPYNKIRETGEVGGFGDIEQIVSKMKENNPRYNYEATVALVKIIARSKYGTKDGYHMYGVSDKFLEENLAVISELEPKPILKALSSTLKDNDADTRFSSLVILERVESDEKYRLYKAVIGDDDRRIRRTAIVGLGKSKDRAYYDDLVSLLDSEDEGVVKAAVTALGYMGDPEALNLFPKLIERYGGDGHFNITTDVIDAVKRIKDPGGVKLLKPLVYDTNDSVRNAAVRALGEIGGDEAIGILIEIVRGEMLWDTPSSVWVRGVNGKTALDALVKAGDPAIPPLQELYKESEGAAREEIREALAELGDPGAKMESLNEILNQEETYYFDKFGLYYEAAPPVGYFISRLNNRDEGARKDAIAALGWLGEGGAVMPLVELLVDKEEKVELKIDIAKSLALIGDERAVDYLEDFTEHENEDLKKASVEAIETIQSPPGVKELKSALSNSDAWVRKRAVIGLGRLKGASTDPEVVGLLISALKDEHKWVRGEAAWVLGKVKGKRALPYLEKMLSDESIWVRKGAVFAIGEILHGKGDGSIAPVLRVLKDENQGVKKMALVSLGKIGGPKAVSLLMKYLNDEDLVLTAIEGLANAREAAVPPLAKIFKSKDPAERYKALLVFRSIQGENVKDYIVGSIDDETDYVRVLAVSSLVFYDEKEIADHLIKAAKDDFPDVRSNAAWVMGMKRIEADIPVLVDLMKNDPDETVRYNATWALGRIASEDSIDELTTALEKGCDTVRENAAWALGRIGNVKAVPFLEKALLDSSTGVRTEAAWALGTIGESRSTAALTGAMTDNKRNAYVKFALTASMKRIENPESVEPMCTGVTMGSTTISYNSVISLGDVKSKEAVKYVSLGFLQDETLVREMTAEVLGSLGDIRAAPYLIEAMSDEEVVVRWQALSALKKISGENHGKNPIEWELWWQDRK